MKSLKILLAVFLSVTFTINAQDIVLQKFMGKNISEAIANYGKPAFQDKNDPEMVMTFYKMPNKDYTFVSGPGGIYQVNATIKYDNKETAFKALDTFLKECLTTGYVVDTLAVENYSLSETKVDITVSGGAANEANKYQLIIEAKKREE